jgi:hypothetical protein
LCTIHFCPAVADCGVAYSGARDSEAGHDLSLAAGSRLSRAAPPTSERCGMALFYPPGADSGASYWLVHFVSGWGVCRVGRLSPGGGSPPGENICNEGVIWSFRVSSSSPRLFVTVATERSSTVRNCGHEEEVDCVRLCAGGMYCPSALLFLAPHLTFPLPLPLRPPCPASAASAHENGRPHLQILRCESLPSPSTHRRPPRFHHGRALLWVRLR